MSSTRTSRCQAKIFHSHRSSDLRQQHCSLRAILLEFSIIGRQRHREARAVPDLGAQKSGRSERDLGLITVSASKSAQIGIGAGSRTHPRHRLYRPGAAKARPPFDRPFPEGQQIGIRMKPPTSGKKDWAAVSGRVVPGARSSRHPHAIAQWLFGNSAYGPKKCRSCPPIELNLTVGWKQSSVRYITQRIRYIVINITKAEPTLLNMRHSRLEGCPHNGER